MPNLRVAGKWLSSFWASRVYWAWRVRTVSNTRQSHGYLLSTIPMRCPTGIADSRHPVITGLVFYVIPNTQYPRKHSISNSSMPNTRGY